jgi:hypothetical protein
MKNNNRKYKAFLHLPGIILLIFSLLIISCTGRKKHISHRELIPARDLVDILTEIYIADGIRYQAVINKSRFSADSIATYEHIINKHGYTAGAMESTMKYYFVKKPKKLVSIYDQLLSNLTEMESLIQKEFPATSVTRENLWKGNEYYFMPWNTPTDSVWFDIPVSFTGTYTINLTVTLYPGDQSVNPHFEAWFSRPDSTGTGMKEHPETVNYIKDGQPHLYILRMNLSEPGITSLRGFLYNHDNTDRGWSKLGKIENISVNLIRN